MIDQDQLIRKALLIRKVEERLLSLFSEGKLFGTVHTCIGQEWSGVAIANYLIEGDSVFSNHRGHGHFIACTNNIKGLFAEIMGKSTGVCGGIGGTQHLHADKFYSNGIQGGMVPISAGKALGMKMSNKKNISVAFIGDGTLGEGVLYETMNIISKWRLPMLIVLENNNYAQSTPNTQTLAGTIQGRAKAFGLKYAKSNTWMWQNLFEDVKEVVGYVREKQMPVFLEIETYRLMAHSKGDDHRNPAEIAVFESKDPLNKILDEKKPEIFQVLNEIEKEIEESVIFAENSNPSVFDCNCMNQFSSDNTLNWLKLEFQRERITTILYNTFKKLFHENPKLVMVGEDIEDPYGGAFKVTKNLSQLFHGRIRNTPISEAAITGIGTGLALEGFLPIVEIMFGDFLSLSFDQIFQHACKFHQMYNGKVSVPLVIRTPMGGKRGYGPTHSQSIEKYFMGMPDLKILSLNHRLSPSLVYERLFDSIDNPVLVIENKILYTRFLQTNNIAGFTIEFSDNLFPAVKISPDNAEADITLVCYGGILEDVENVIEKIFYKEEILCEVICPTLICPIDITPISDSIRKTRKLVVIEEGSNICALGSEIIAQLAESSVQVDYIKRVGCNTIIPSSGESEANVLPGSEKIFNTIREVVNA